jgi:4-amino-4-deoxy-L-arabinose transferase-like glycosyltransferase
MLAALIAYAAAAGMVRASVKPLWYDELYTLALSNQPRVALIWDALHHAVDTFPPLFYLVERGASALVRNERLGFRLISIAAFCCTVFCIFVFVKRQSGNTYAWICAPLLFLSTLYDTYAVEARGYSLALACLALALVCYQRADSRRWIICLAAALAGAEAFHYYAVFGFLPFALAEAAFYWETRRLRLGVWFAMLCGFTPLILAWPMLMSVKHAYGADFWAQASLGRLVNVYGWFFDLPVALGIALGFAAVAWTIGPGVWQRWNSVLVGPYDAPIHEAALVLGWLGLPCMVFLVAKITHSGMTQRYSLPALLGFPLAAGLILPRFTRQLAALLGSFLWAALLAQEVLFFFPLIHYQDVPASARVEDLVNQAGYTQLPVVISSGLDFLEIVHSASPDQGRRFVCLVDASKAVVYAGTGNVDTNLLALRSYLSLPVYRFDEFKTRNPRFLLYSPGAGNFDWWPARLLDDGYSLELLAIGADHKARLYLAGASK